MGIEQVNYQIDFDSKGYCIKRSSYIYGHLIRLKAAGIIDGFLTLESVFSYILRDSTNAEKIEIKLSENAVPKEYLKEISGMLKEFKDTINGIKIEKRKKLKLEKIVATL